VKVRPKVGVHVHLLVNTIDIFHRYTLFIGQVPYCWRVYPRGSITHNMRNDFTIVMIEELGDDIALVPMPRIDVQLVR